MTYYLNQMLKNNMTNHIRWQYYRLQSRIKHKMAYFTVKSILLGDIAICNYNIAPLINIANCIVWTGNIDHYIVIGHESPTNPISRFEFDIGI